MKALMRGAHAVALALVMAAAARAEPLPLARVTPDELRWRPAPTGAQVAILAGDPLRAGVYVLGMRFPAGFRNPPHVHPDERIVTILTGTLLVGYGARFDESAMKALPPGSMFTEPAQQPHFVWARDGEVVIQVVGHGPSATTWIGR